MPKSPKNKPASPAKVRQRPIGLAKGTINVPASFFEDLPAETFAFYEERGITSFPKTNLRDAASCLPVAGKAKTLKVTDTAINKGAVKRKRQP